MLLNTLSQTGQEISKLETQVGTLKVQNQQLTNELSQLQNLDWIAMKANELGLKPSTSALTLNGLPPIAMSNQ